MKYVLSWKYLLFLILVCSVKDSDTDMYEISISGKTIHCVKCPAGTYKVSDCSSEYGNAVCEPCTEDTYQPRINIAASCAKCRTACPYNTPQQRVQLEQDACTATSDMVCVCKEGLYDDGGACRKLTACRPGQGVKTKGTPYNDTVCANCTKGTFSPNTSNSEQCISCSVCKEDEETVDGSCDGVSDTQCIPLVSGSGLSSTSIAWIIGGILMVAIICGVCILIYRYRGRLAPYVKYHHVNDQTKSIWKPMDYTFDTTNTNGNFINVIGSSQTVETINDMETLTTAAKSVGLICLGDQPIATCFRVGTNYVMTAFHVLEKIMETTEFQTALSQMYIIFSYKRPRQPVEEKEKFYFKKVPGVAEIPFYNKGLDCVVFELKLQDDKVLPASLELARVPSKAKLSFITQRAELEHIQCRDVVGFFIDPNSQETKNGVDLMIRKGKKFLTRHGLQQLAGAVDGDRQNILNEDRWLLHCCSSHGASGSPCIGVVNGKAYVVTMLLHGYPDWYYNPLCASIRDLWKKVYTVEQGANFASVAAKLHASNPALHEDIFKVNQ